MHGGCDEPVSADSVPTNGLGHGRGGWRDGETRRSCEAPHLVSDLTGLREDQEIPEALNEYIHFIESQLETPIRCVSVGPDRTQTIERGLLM